MNLQSLLTAVLAFVSTNIDDIFILMLFYSNGRFRESTIVIGQYLGIASLVIVSLIAAYIGGFFDQRYVGLLGLFPIYLGVRQVVSVFKKDDEEEETNIKSGVLAIAGVTIANGADNIGVYVPLLSTMSIVEKIQLLVVFAIATFLWCMAAKYLAHHPLIAKQLSRYGHLITPVVLIFLGVFILFESGTFSLLNS